MGEWVDKKILVTGLILAAVLIGAFVAVYYGPTIISAFSGVPPPKPPTYTFTSSLTANFKIMETTTSTLLNSGVDANFFSTGATPLAYLSVDMPVAIGTYNMLDDVWSTVLDAGSYQELLTSINFDYPSLIPVTVPGTNESTMTVNMVPFLGTVTERATPIVTTVITAYDVSTGLYDIASDVTGINATYTRWQITYTVAASGPLEKLAAGYIYMSIYPGLSITSATFGNGAAAVTADATGTKTGLTGYFIQFPDLVGGTTSTMVLQLTRTVAAAAGTYTIELYEDGACNNPLLRWWSDDIQSLTVT